MEVFSEDALLQSRETRRRCRLLQVRQQEKEISAQRRQIIEAQLQKKRERQQQAIDVGED